MKRLIAVITIALLSSFAVSPAQAKGPYGPYNCPWCEITNTLGALEEIIAFVKAEVNKQLDQYVPGDLVTVCNGTSCLTLRYLPYSMPQFTPLGPVVPDPHIPYKNAVSARTLYFLN